MYFQSCPVKYALRVSKINYILMLQNQVGLSPSKWPIDSVDWPELRCRELVLSSGLEDLRVSESPDLRVSKLRRLGRVIRHPLHTPIHLTASLPSGWSTPYSLLFYLDGEKVLIIRQYGRQTNGSMLILYPLFLILHFLNQNALHWCFSKKLKIITIFVDV